jgi:mRNA interferase MazF
VGAHARRRPVLALTRDPVADRLGAVVVAACTRTIRGLSGELPLGPEDGMPAACVATFDNLHTLRRGGLRRPVTRLLQAKVVEACRVLSRARERGPGFAGETRTNLRDGPLRAVRNALGPTRRWSYHAVASAGCSSGG